MIQRRVRVLCVDDHAFLVEGLRSRFEAEAGIEFVGRLATADDLVAEVARLRPDIVLLDIEMPGRDPFEAAEDVQRRYPMTRVVFLSAHVRDHYVSAAFRAGAFGYFSKADEPRAILEGLARADRGEFVMGPSVAERCNPGTPAARRHAAVGPSDKLSALTPREQEVLRLFGRGMARAEVAASLYRSVKTVDGHRERIMKKLGIHSGPELVRFAIREGLAEA